jgi:hypothetical protein
MPLSLLQQIVAAHDAELARQESPAESVATLSEDARTNSIAAFRPKPGSRPEGITRVARERISGAVNGEDAISVALADDDAFSVSVLAERRREEDELAGFADIRRFRPALTLEQYRRMSISERCDIILAAAKPATSEIARNSVQALSDKPLALSDKPLAIRELASTDSVQACTSDQPQSLAESEQRERISTSHRAEPGIGVEQASPKDSIKSDPFQLLDQYERGELTPLPVELGPIPTSVPADHRARRVARDMALILGLMRAAGDQRPMMYAVSFCMSRMGWKSRSQASGAISDLRRWGVIELVGKLPSLDGRIPTHLYDVPSAE